MGIIAYTALTIAIICSHLTGENSAQTPINETEISNEKIENKSSPIDCYWQQQTGPQLPDIIDLPPTKRSIFFIESSCASFTANRLVLRSRVACAIESAALHNPKIEIYLVFLAPVRTGLANDSLLRELTTSYRNVRVRTANLERLAVGSSLEELVSANGPLRDTSKHAIVHASDIARLLLLWRYGGIYLDTDFIFVRPVGHLSPNFGGMQSPTYMANGALGFSNDTEGHSLAMECIKDVKANFSGISWDKNGPQVITRLVKKKCSSQFECAGTFKIYPKDTFYPIEYEHWFKYFLRTDYGDFKRQLKYSLAVHVFDTLSRNFKPRKGSPYLILARVNCPKTYYTVKARF